MCTGSCGRATQFSAKLLYFSWFDAWLKSIGDFKWFLGIPSAIQGCYAYELCAGALTALHLVRTNSSLDFVQLSQGGRRVFQGAPLHFEFKQRNYRSILKSGRDGVGVFPLAPIHPSWAPRCASGDLITFFQVDGVLRMHSMAFAVVVTWRVSCVWVPRKASSSRIPFHWRLGVPMR